MEHISKYLKDEALTDDFIEAKKVMSKSCKYALKDSVLYKVR